MRRQFLLATGFFVALACSPSAKIWAADEAYRLGPQDKLRIKVHEWRASRGEAYEWSALNGDFTVGTEGVSLPLIGTVPAVGSKIDELAQVISERLQSKVGLLERPDTSVEVVQFRPFYMVGKVDKPGEYAYRPGLTVLQAVSVAGGLYRPADPGLLRFERESISIRGNLRLLGVQRDTLLARRARLQAELQGIDTIPFPPELAKRQAEPSIAQLVREEQLLFEARRTALKMQIESLTQQRILLTKEVDSLRAKSETQERQLSSIRRELESVGSLVTRGLAVAPRQLSLERLSAEIEASRIDLNTAMLRAQQDASKTERSILELRNQRQNDVIVELRQTQAKIDEASEQIGTSEKLVYEVEVTAPAAESERSQAQMAQPIYSIIRRGDGGTQEKVVTENTPVKPGDVLKVQFPSSLDLRQPAVSAAPRPGQVTVGQAAR